MQFIILPNNFHSSLMKWQATQIYPKV
uniref:Uncharacterized protein n=1 Tax=Arundo donax TaxID=35708 RepID=A0A0A8YTG1_ARUDO